MGKRADMDDSSRRILVQYILGKCKGNGQPKRGVITEAANRFQVCRKSVSRIWASAKQQGESGQCINVSARRKGRFRQNKWELDYDKIVQLPHDKRGTIESMVVALDIPRSTMGRLAKTLLRPHTNALKPLLIAPNMLTRLSFSLKALQFDFQNNTPKFKAMENTIHIDEKWFYLTRKSCRYYMTPMEADPLRVCQSKNHLPKVMFMCAVSRSVFAEDGSVLFDGKIGIWPFVEEVTALRNSIKRKKGTKEIKPIQSITRQVIKDCIINEVVPAIKHKWPSCLSKNITIQQDNARPHIKNSDPEFQECANADGFQISLVQQPPNSPDCNGNDLGFFAAIQGLQQREKCRTSDDLIIAVQNSFMALEPMTLNKVFLSLQCVLIEIMKCKGQNNYKTPHMKKDVLIRQGTLPTKLCVPEYLVRESIDYLIGEEHTEGIEILMESLGLSVPQYGEGIPDLNM